MTLSSSSEPRGFALYVGISEKDAQAAGHSLHHIVTQLKESVEGFVPGSAIHAAIALAPVGAGGKDLDIVRMALHDPAALAKLTPSSPPEKLGVIIDISRKRVVLEGDTAPLTFKEFEMLQFLVLREGQTVNRADIIEALWVEGEEESPSARTIDVHVRRLRAKLGRFEDIVRTVRGVGYRFDRHADVTIQYGVAPSPDMI
jgi:DNA-binding winged helix-turn-helix (wHTH) protein